MYIIHKHYYYGSFKKKLGKLENILYLRIEGVIFNQKNPFSIECLHQYNLKTFQESIKIYKIDQQFLEKSPSGVNFKNHQ